MQTGCRRRRMKAANATVTSGCRTPSGSAGVKAPVSPCEFSLLTSLMILFILCGLVYKYTVTGPGTVLVPFPPASQR